MGPIQIRGTDLADRRWAAVMARWEFSAPTEDDLLRYSGSATAPEDYSRTSEPVLLDGGDREETVVTRTAYPTYRGALVVCQGGDRADVKLAVTEAVSALTGLSSDRVTVAKCQ